MIGSLTERDLKKFPSTQSLHVLEGDEGDSYGFLNQENACEFAEASDTIRLFELLHRDEYEPVVAVRDRTGEFASIRVYFRQLHETDFQSNDESVLDIEIRWNHQRPR